jgi:hypothetical protein
MTGTAGAATLSKRDRLRRIAILCCSFIRNLAYYRAGQAQEVVGLLNANAKNASIWRQMNSNFIDMCVLEWAKIFVDMSGAHGWKRVVSKKADFEAGLLSHLGIDAAAYENQRQAVREYRNEFVAHLGEERQINIPRLDIALGAVRFLYNHLASTEAKPGDLAGYARSLDELDRGYEQCAAEATVLFRQQVSLNSSNGPVTPSLRFWPRKRTYQEFHRND